MNVDDSRAGFRTFLKRKGMKLTELSIADGIRLAIEFFRDVRMDDAQEGDGDGLIFYYAHTNRGGRSPYEVGMIRTFRKQGGGLARLRLTFNYPWTEVIIHRGLQQRLLPQSPEGSRFCWNRDDLEKFEHFALGHAVTQTVITMPSTSVHLRFEPLWGPFG